MTRSAIIIGVKSYVLSKNEKEFLNEKKPLGIILFRRNIKDKSQVIKLTNLIREMLGRNAMILIDQEGGRVNRLNNDVWDQYPAASFFGNIAKHSIKKARKVTYNNFKSIAKTLKELGINYNCAPVLDLKIKGASNVIGNRAFDRNSEIVSLLSLEASKGMLSEGVLPILKHIPGHGRAKVDSHLELPIIKSNYNSLKDDFYPFIKLNKMPLAMIAHIKYNYLDANNCATYSKFLINKVIKQEIGFKGILLSDDLCMKALKGSFKYRAKKAIEAGCNIVLHCDPTLTNIRKSTDGAGEVPKKLLSQINDLKNLF